MTGIDLSYACEKYDILYDKNSTYKKAKTNKFKKKIKLFVFTCSFDDMIFISLSRAPEVKKFFY